MIGFLRQLAKKIHFYMWGQEADLDLTSEDASNIRGRINATNLFTKGEKIRNAKVWHLILYDASGKRIKSQPYKRSRFEVIDDTIHIEMEGHGNSVSMKWMNNTKENHPKFIYKLFAGRIEVAEWVWNAMTIHPGDTVIIKVNLDFVFTH